MPRRRAFGAVIRRRRRGRNVDGTRRTGYYPGFYVRIRQGGREITRYAGPDRATARDVLERLQREADRQELLGERPERDVTFEDFTVEYLEYSKRNHAPSTQDNRRRLVENVLVPHFRGRTLGSITRPDVERFLLGLKGIVGATRNRHQTALSSMFRRALDLGYVQRNPVREVRRAREVVTPLPLVTDDEQDRLLALIPEAHRAIYVTALDTGARLGELLRLEWKDVDLDGGKLMVRVSKNKRPRMMVLTIRLQEVLQGVRSERVRPLRGPDLIFRGAAGADGKLKGSWRCAFKKAAKGIGHPELRIHDLRHLAAIALVRGGLDLPSIQSYLGHGNLISTLRYASYADESASARAARILDAGRSRRSPVDQPARAVELGMSDPCAGQAGRTISEQQTLPRERPIRTQRAGDRRLRRTDRTAPLLDGECRETRPPGVRTDG